MLFKSHRHRIAFNCAVRFNTNNTNNNYSNNNNKKATHQKQLLEHQYSHQHSDKI